MRLAIIPARAGSKRIPDKNIRDFCGKPMIAYALETATASGLFDEIHVSTDSEDILRLVRDLGFETGFLRPDHLSGDHTGLMDVFRWVLQEYGNQGQEFEDVCTLFPACPLLRPTDLVRAFDVYESNKREFPLHVVSTFPVPVEWAYRRDEASGALTPVQPGAYAIRSQDIEKAYYESGPFSIFGARHIMSDEPVTDEGFVSVVLPRERLVDIDEPDDWTLAEILYRGHESVRGSKA